MPSLREHAREQLARVAERGLTRRLRASERLDGALVRQDDREYVSFSCNDPFGLSRCPAVIAAARKALEHYGAGAAASRLVTGNHPAYAELERALADFKGTEAALVFGSGYLANIGTVPALVGKGDLVLVDRLCHACLWDGARLSGAAVLRFDHNDVGHCRSLLKDQRAKHGRALVLTETVFSMDGDLAPVAELARLAHEHDAWLLTDDAHGLGIVSSASEEADARMGTLSKATGSYGGYVCGPTELIDWLTNRARGFMFTTGLPPASVAAAAAALAVLRDDEGLRRKPLENARRFTAALGRPPAQSAIVPVIVGTPERALAASDLLREHGLLVVPIRPPSVPPGTARLRFAFSALHEAEPIERAARLLLEHGYLD